MISSSSVYQKIDKVVYAHFCVAFVILFYIFFLQKTDYQ